MPVDWLNMDFSEMEARVLAHLSERQKEAIRHLELGGVFLWVDSQGPSVQDLVELGLVRKKHIADRRGNVTDITYRNISGKTINVDGVEYADQSFIDIA